MLFGVTIKNALAGDLSHLPAQLGIGGKFFDGLCQRLRVFRRNDKTFYANAQLPHKQQGKDISSPESRTNAPAILLEGNTESVWTKQPDKARPLHVLDAKQWDKVKQQVLSTITPRDGKSGTVVDFLYDEETGGNRLFPVSPIPVQVTNPSIASSSP